MDRGRGRAEAPTALGRPSHPPVRLHVLILVFPVLSSLLALLRAGVPAFALVFVSRGPLGVLMVLVHELGHIAEAARHGCTPSHILLWPLGGLAVIATCGNSHRQHALIAAAGSATHVPMILGWLLLLASTGHLTSTGLSIRLQQTSAANQSSVVSTAGAVLDCSQIIVSLLCSSCVCAAGRR